MSAVPRARFRLYPGRAYIVAWALHQTDGVPVPDAGLKKRIAKLEGRVDGALFVR